MARINFQAKSLLAFLTAISLLGWLIGAGTGISEIKQISIPIFVICFVIWLIFIFLSIGRNIKNF